MDPYFTDIPVAELPTTDPNAAYASQYLTGVKELQIGSGSNVFRGDRQGIWLGAAKFADAPFRVDMNGNMVAESIAISGYIPTGQALADIGSGNITGTYISDNAIVTSKLATNSVIASKIASDAVTASKIDVDELSAITADVGTLTAGIIQGVIIKTANSGARIEMYSSAIFVYDSSNDEVAAIYGSTNAGGTLDIAGSDSSSTIFIRSGSSGTVSIGISTTPQILVDDDIIQLNSPLMFDHRSSHPGSASSWTGCMYYNTSLDNLVYSDGSGWFQVQASAA